MGFCFINRKGYPAKVMEKFLCREFDIVISTPIIKELQDVLRRPRIKNLSKITDDEIDMFVKLCLRRLLTIGWH